MDLLQYAHTWQKCERNLDKSQIRIKEYEFKKLWVFKRILATLWFNMWSVLHLYHVQKGVINLFVFFQMRRVIYWSNVILQLFFCNHNSPFVFSLYCFFSPVELFFSNLVICIVALIYDIIFHIMCLLKVYIHFNLLFRQKN